MPIRLVEDHAQIQRPSLRVADAARDLQVDISMIYRLAKSGELEAHYVGTRGVRIYADSLRTYKESRPYITNKSNTQGQVKPKASSWRTPAQREAEAFLIAQGCM